MRSYMVLDEVSIFFFRVLYNTLNRNTIHVNM